MTQKLYLIIALLCALAGTTTTAQAENTWSVTNDGNVFTISRTETTTAETVKYRTVSLTALAGKHFTEATGTLEFAADEASKTVTVTETAVGDIEALYRYQTGTSRKYRFEVLDNTSGSQLAYRERSIEYGSGYQIVLENLFKNVAIPAFTDAVTVDDADDDFGQAYHAIPIANYFSATAPQEYTAATGTQLGMTFDFQAKEIDDGYQYLQVLVDETENYDSDNHDGDVGELNYAQLLAGFGHDPGSTNTNYAYYTFPIPADGDIALSNHDGIWRQYGNTVGRLYTQKFKPGYQHGHSGRMLADANLQTLGVRFDASGKHDDKWQVKNFKAHIHAIDDVNPTILKANVTLSPAPYTEGSTFYVSVPFSEIVVVGSSPKITTNWGELNYTAGSGTNVLIFKGTIGSGITPAENLTITALSGGYVRDLRGNPFTGQANAITVTFPAQSLPQAWGSGDGTEDYPYIITDFNGFNELVNCVNTRGVDFGPDDTHPDGYFFKLGFDITYNGGINNYTAIGNPNCPFRGNFDGDGHVIRGININKPVEPYQGFFGYVVGGTVKNVIIESSTIYNGGDYAGAVVGCCVGGTVSDCFVYSTTVTCNGTHHGAIVGNDGATLERNYYRACTVTDQAAQNVYTLGLGTDITASDPTITYNSTDYYEQGALVSLTTPLGKVFASITVTKDADNSDVTASVLSGNTITVPGYDISVSATFTDLWGIADGNDGSDQKPYIISDVAGWNLLASEVNKGTNLWEKNFKLSDDFDNSTTPVTTMVGNADHHFNGKIRGNGRTLTVNLSNTTEDEGCAPFFRLNQGYIENLRVAGTITTDDKLAGGIASHMLKSKLWGCVSSVTIISSVSGDGTHGGLVGLLDDWGWENELTGCVFDGVICCTDPGLTNSCGGLIGWKGGTQTYPTSVVITDCLYAPAAIPSGKYALNEEGCCTFLRGEGDEHNCEITISSDYYTETLGSVPSLQEGARKVYPLATRPTNVGEAVTADYGFAKLHRSDCIEYGGTFYTAPANNSLKEDGTSSITLDDGYFTDIVLEGRTLYKDGYWNTLCLPFAMSAEQIAASVLAGADIRTLSSASFENGELMLNFTPAAPAEGAVTSITAGVPYMIRWTGGGSNIVEPTIEAVIIDFTQHDVTCDLGDGKSVAFVGTRAVTTYDSEDRSVLLLGGGNTLFYPQTGATINAQRAYFQLTGLTAGDVTNSRMFFGDDSEATGIINCQLSIVNSSDADAWNTLDGRKLDGKPTKKGLYIHGGKKVVIP